MASPVRVRVLSLLDDLDNEERIRSRRPRNVPSTGRNCPKVRLWYVPIRGTRLVIINSAPAHSCARLYLSCPPLIGSALQFFGGGQRLLGWTDIDFTCLKRVRSVSGMPSPVSDAPAGPSPPRWTARLRSPLQPHRLATISMCEASRAGGHTPSAFFTKAKARFR
jgi:hypothetical protein